MNDFDYALFVCMGFGQVAAAGALIVFVWWYMKQEIDLLRSRYIEKSRELLSMQEQTIHHDRGKYPRWRKTETGVLVALNMAYDDIYLKPRGIKRGEYVGRRDVDVWGDQIGMQYWENDLQVLRSGDTLVKRESVGEGVTHVIIKSLTVGSDGKRYVDGWSFPDQIFVSLMKD